MPQTPSHSMRIVSKRDIACVPKTATHSNLYYYIFRSSKVYSAFLFFRRFGPTIGIGNRLHVTRIVVNEPFEPVRGERACPASGV